MAHINKSSPWLELIKLHEQTPPSPPPYPLRVHKLQTPIKSKQCLNLSVGTGFVNISKAFSLVRIFDKEISPNETHSLICDTTQQYDLFLHDIPDSSPNELHSDYHNVAPCYPT